MGLARTSRRRWASIHCTGGPWWNKSESTGTATVTPSANDTTIGLQGELSLDVGVPQTVVYVTEMAPGAPTDGWTATASATPDSLWPPNGDFASIAVDVEELEAWAPSLVVAVGLASRVRNES